MDPAAEQTDAPRSRFGRARLWASALRRRATRVGERAEAERARHRSVDATFEMVDRDVELGGGIIAAALAYRLFIWLLPLTLVAVAGLGFAAEASSASPEETAEHVGLDDLVSDSVASAAEGPGRWYALLIGIPILLFVTRSLHRALIGAHRLLWSDVRAAAPRPTLTASVSVLALVLCFLLVSGLAGAARAWADGPGVVVTILAALPYGALWLLVSLHLPHRDADWKALIPGALLFGLGIELLHLVAAYLLQPYAIAKQGTYGAIGAAAALLFALFLLSRLVVAAAVLNVTLWERRGLARSE